MPNGELLLLVHDLLCEASAIRGLPFKFTSNADDESGAKSAEHNAPLRTNIAIRQHDTCARGMQDLWAGAVVPGRLLSLMSRFSGARIPSAVLAPVIHRVAVQTPQGRPPHTMKLGPRQVLPDPSNRGWPQSTRLVSSPGS